MVFPSYLWLSSAFMAQALAGNSADGPPPRDPYEWFIPAVGFLIIVMLVSIN